MGYTREDVERNYKVNENDTICSQGKFEGQPRYAPYFWDASLADGSNDARWESDGLQVDIYYPDDSDVKEFPELAGVAIVEIWEDRQGFVHCISTDLVV